MANPNAEQVDATLVAAKNVLGHGNLGVNVETQIRRDAYKLAGDKNLSGGKDVTSLTVTALKNALGDLVNEDVEKAILDQANKVLNDENLPKETPVTIKEDSIVGDTTEQVNKTSKDAFEAGKMGGGEPVAGQPGAARSQIGAATNSGNVGGPGAGGLGRTGR